MSWKMEFRRTDPETGIVLVVRDNATNPNDDDWIWTAYDKGEMLIESDSTYIRSGVAQAKADEWLETYLINLKNSA